MKKFWVQYKNYLQKQFSDSPDNDVRDIDYWRNYLYTQFLLYIIPIGFIVYIPSMIMSILANLPVVALADTLVFVIIILLAFNKKISIYRKKYLFACCLYLLSVVLLIFLGSMGPGLIYLVATSVFIVLVINKRAAYLSVLINFCLYGLLALSLLFPETSISFSQNYSFGSWIAVGSNFLLINFVLVASIALLLDGLQKTILNEKKLLNELKVEGIKLNKAKEKAIQSDRFKSAFLANMSHEIRTPLNAIIGFANLLSRKKNSADQGLYVKIINNSSNQLLNLINDIIDLSKIEAGKVSVKHEKIKFKDFALNIVASMNQLCPKHLEFKHAVDENDLQKELGIDVHKVSQIITNLVTNSFKYTKEGFIELKMMLSPDNKTFSFSITDTGIGISKNNQQKVFQRFYQEDAMHSGVGLGLSICASLVKTMDGKIEMESETGKGSTFTVHLPNQLEIADATSSLGNELLVPNLQSCNGKKILIAEDDENSFSVLKEFLEEDQHIITRASNGIETINQAKSSKFDLVLMDIKMPAIDGYEATRKIRQFDTTTPIVALTAFAFNSDAEKAIEAGCNDFLTKPVDFEKLKNLLVKHIN